MKVLLVGVHNRYFSNTVEFREKAIRDLGHKLVFFDDRSFIVPGRIRKHSDFLQKWDLNRINKNIVRCARKEKPDVCLFLGGQRVMRGTILALKELELYTVLWTTDIPSDFDNIISSAVYYNNIFCAGTEAIDLLNSKITKSPHWLPFACDPELHHPFDLATDEKKEFNNDIVFVGSYYPNRAKILETLSDLDIKVYGPGWSKIGAGSNLKHKIIDRRIDYDEWIKIFSGAKIVLSIHYQDGKTPCYQASPRIFEAMACKSFVLSDDQKDVRELFEDKKQIVFYEDNLDLRRNILYYLENKQARDEIALSGYNEVIEKHTYKNRIEKILKYVK